MFFRFVVAISLLLCTSVIASREIKHRVVLKPGQPGTVLRGIIRNPDDAVIYIFKARAGQHIFIRFQPDRQLDAGAVLVAPSGKNVQNGAIFDSILDESGTFRIRIEPLFHGSVGTFRLRLRIN